jgi:hypothetical protein
MAETEIEAFNALKRLLEAASNEAAAEAIEAAASVYLEAAKAAAPVGSDSNNPWSKGFGRNASHSSGQLRESIQIIGTDKSKLLSSLQGNVSQRVFVGPEKKKGYYGFFVEKGHNTAGPHRIKRTANRTTHSQQGVISRKSVPARPWFEPAIKSAESRAIEAGQRAFNKKLEEIDSRR